MQKNMWGLDFRKNMDVVKDCYAKYSTHLFTSEAENIIEEHDVNKVSFHYYKTGDLQLAVSHIEKL